MARYFDTHAHYDDGAFDADRDGLLSALPRHGVAFVVNASSDIASSEKSVSLAEKYPFFYAAAGIHPHEASKAPANWESRLRKLAENKKVRAVGEIGLDYHYDFSPRPVQKELFAAQLDTAKDLGLPVVIHERDALEDTLDILKAHGDISGVFHCFSGSVETARYLLSRGFYLSFGGVLTFKNAKKAPEVVAFMPADRLMLETDCPYLAPAPFRGRRNDSTLLPFIAEKAAELRGISRDELVCLTFDNAVRFFDIHESAQ